MLVVLGYDLDNDTVNTIVQADLHASDILDLINETAVEEDHLHHVWHLSDDAGKKFQEVMNDLFNEFSASETKVLLEGF